MSKLPHKRKKPRTGAASAADSDSPRRKLCISLEALEIARGHDGFLRGKPEPALLIAAYRTNGLLPASLVGRQLVRARLRTEIPCSVGLEERELRYDARFAVTERILVLVFAVEENSGEGLTALYAAFESPAQLLIYSASEPEPSPLALDDWAQKACSAPCACPVEVLFGGATLEKVTGSDQFIAASAFSVATQVRADEAWRLPLVARDARNDWTLLMRMRVVA